MYFNVYTKVVCWDFVWFNTQHIIHTHSHILQITTHKCQHYKIRTYTIDLPHPMHIEVMCDNQYKWGGRTKHITENKLQTVESTKATNTCDINPLTSESALWMSHSHFHAISWNKSDLRHVFVLTSYELDHFTPTIELTSNKSTQTLGSHAINWIGHSIMNKITLFEWIESLFGHSWEKNKGNSW